MDEKHQQLVEEAAAVQAQGWEMVLALLPEHGIRLLYLCEFVAWECLLLEMGQPAKFRAQDVRRDLRENVQLIRAMMREVAARARV